ncbi:MAG: hypothetical protein WC809_11065 [Sinimarinibacterium sp.]
MIAPSDLSLAEQRLALRQQLQEQRRRIAHQLDGAATADGSFPRSMTMRLVIRRPDLAVRLALGIATLLKRR